MSCVGGSVTKSLNGDVILMAPLTFFYDYGSREGGSKIN